MRQRKGECLVKVAQRRAERAALAGFNKLYCSEVPVSEGERGAGGRHLLGNEHC